MKLSNRKLLGFFLFIYVSLTISALHSAQDKSKKEEKTKISFSKDIQPIFTKSCAIPDCHSVKSHKVPKGMILSEGMAYQNIVNVKSKEMPRAMRVTPGDLNKSYLYDKITGNQDDGDRMPPKKSLAKENIELIKAWILAGAPGDSTALAKDSASLKENIKDSEGKK